MPLAAVLPVGGSGPFEHAFGTSPALPSLDALATILGGAGWEVISTSKENGAPGAALSGGTVISAQYNA